MRIKILVVCFIGLCLTTFSVKEVQANICYAWVFKDPLKNPIVPSSNFVGYWLPPVDKPETSFPVGDTNYYYAIDKDHPNGPFYATKTDEEGNVKVVHNGLDIFAWVEKIDDKCYIRLFKTTDVVKPTKGGQILSVDNKDDGSASIVHPPGTSLSTFEAYGHIKPGDAIDMGTPVTTDTALGTLSDLGDANFVHLHYSVFIDSNSVDPLQYMKKIEIECGGNQNVPAPGALILGSIGLSFFGWFKRRSRL